MSAPHIFKTRRNTFKILGLSTSGLLHTKHRSEEAVNLVKEPRNTFKMMGLLPIPSGKNPEKPQWAGRPSSVKTNDKHPKNGDRKSCGRRPHASSCSRGRGDEFYTRPEDVEVIMEQYLPFLRGKKILVPCGGDNDPWATYLREHGVCDITTDPNLDYDSFDFSEYDFVISNPPFSMTRHFLSKIDEAGCGGLVIIHDTSVGNVASISLMSKGWRVYDEGAPTVFNRPDGTQAEVNTKIITSFQTSIHEGTKNRRTGHMPAVITDQGIIRYKNTADVPQHWNGVIAVPLGFAHIRFDRHIHTLSPKQIGLSVGSDGEFASLFVSCDGSTVVKEGADIVRYSASGKRVVLTPATTLRLAS